MPYHEEITKVAVSIGEGGEVVVPPRDLSLWPTRVITAYVATGANASALSSMQIEFGPTDQGPWIAEDIDEEDIYDLAPGSAAAYRVSRADRFLRISATGTPTGGMEMGMQQQREGEGMQQNQQQTTSGTDLTIWIDAV